MLAELKIGKFAGARTPSKHCRGTFKQGIEPRNAHMGPMESWPLVQGFTPPLPTPPSKSFPMALQGETVVKKKKRVCVRYFWKKY